MSLQLREFPACKCSRNDSCYFAITNEIIDSDRERPMDAKTIG